MAAKKTSNLRKISVTPSRWRRSVQASQGQNIQSLSEVSDYPRMQTINFGNGQLPYRFYFPFPPTQVAYEQISPELVEIERAGRKPLIFLGKDRAARVSFQFLIAVPKDGMFIDVEDSLETLRAMTQTLLPVQFLNMDKFLGLPSSSGSLDLTFWSILDLSFESVRRNSAQRITSATASISLIENENPQIDIITLPEIEYTEDVPQETQAGSAQVADDPPNFIDYITIDSRTGTSSLSLAQRRLQEQ